MLINLAYKWLHPSDNPFALYFAVPGIIAAALAYYFGFSKIALKNIARLYTLPAKACIFAFQAWKSYLIIVFMIVLGITLRHSALPNDYLAVIYITIGGALFLSSIHYYLHLLVPAGNGPQKKLM